MANVAWIGLGLMGNPMSKHLIAAGDTVKGFDIEPKALQAVAENGVRPTGSIAEACLDADVVYTMLPSGADVYEVMTSDGGVFANVRPGTIILDCSTTGINYAKRLHEAAKQ